MGNAISPRFYFIFIIMFGIAGMLRANFLNIQINTDTTTQIQNEQQIAVNPKDSLNLVAVWRDFRFGYRQVGHAASFDGGHTWVAETVFVEPIYIWDSDPGITVDSAGNFYAVILSYYSTSEPNGLFVLKSSDGGVSWGPPVTVINGVAGVFEDKELIACDRSGGPYTDNLYVAWARFYATQILVSRSIDGGNSFQAPVQVSDVGGVQWPVPCVGPNSEVYIAWCANSAIRFDRSTNGGVTFGTDRTVASIASMSRYVKGTIQTFSYPAIDVDITGGPYNGNIYVAFMDTGNDGYPDMFFTRSTDQGNTWSARVRINDDPAGNHIDQFHPWLAVDPNGVISVIFYDSRLDASNILCDVYLAQSTDGGITWLPNTRVTTVSFDLRAGFLLENNPYDPARPLAEYRAGLIGEYNCLVSISRDNVIPIWTDTRSGDQDTYVGVNENIGIAEFRLKSIDCRLSLSPNPVYRNLSITIDAEQEDEVEIAIYDATGKYAKTAFRGTINKGIRKFPKIDLTRYPPGVYFVSVTGTKIIARAKFVLINGD